ncbi:FtsB family cell division protein [Thiovibrio sp. JS02]
MPPSRSQSDSKKLLISSILILVLLGAWAIFGPYGALKYYRVAKELNKVLADNEELRLSNEALRKEITKLKKDPVHLEEVARQQFGLIKKNEVIYDFPEKKKRHE